MKTIKIEVKDDYVNRILDFLKLLPENVAKIDLLPDETFEQELLKRVEEVKKGKVKTVSREEIFGDI